MTFEHAVEDWKSNDEWRFADTEAAWKFFYHAAIQHYKDSVLKDAGEPVAYMTTDEEGSASMLFFDRSEALKYSGDEEPVNLFTESQLAAAQEEWNQCGGLLDDAHRSIEMLEDQLATEEQRVAEWQPIETAPKDEDLIVTDGNNVALGRWVGRYFAWGYGADPTHWMPLPEAPKGERP